MNKTDLNPNALIQLGSAFWAAQTLMTGVEVGLFTLLAKGTASAEEIATSLDLHPAALPDFLDSLVALGLLERSDGRYSDSPAANLYLDREKETYLGGYMLFHKNVLYPSWGRLSETLRTGKARTGELTQDTQHFQQMLYSSDEKVRRVTSFVDAVLVPLKNPLTEKFPWRDYKTFLDVGGSHGTLATWLVRKHPHLRGTVFDLPQIEEPFKRLARRDGVEDLLGFHAGDFFVDALPPAELVIFGHVLHNWTKENCRILLKKAFDAVQPGGAVLIYDTMLDDDRREKTHNLLHSLNMFLTLGSSEYTIQEYLSLIEEAGFVADPPIPLEETNTLVVGRKQA